MSKIDKLIEMATTLTEDQIEGLIHYAEMLLAEKSVYELAPQEVRDSIERGLADSRDGRTVSLEEFRREMDEIIAKAR